MKLFMRTQLLFAGCFLAQSLLADEQPFQSTSNAYHAEVGYVLAEKLEKRVLEKVEQDGMQECLELKGVLGSKVGTSECEKYKQELLNFLSAIIIREFYEIPSILHEDPVDSVPSNINSCYNARLFAARVAGAISTGSEKEFELLKQFPFLTPDALRKSAQKILNDYIQSTGK